MKEKKFLEIRINSDGDFYVGKYAHHLIEIFDEEVPSEILRKELPKMRAELYPTEKIAKYEDYKMHHSLVKIINMLDMFEEEMCNNVDTGIGCSACFGNQDFSIDVSTHKVGRIGNRVVITLDGDY